MAESDETEKYIELVKPELEITDEERALRRRGRYQSPDQLRLREKEEFRALDMFMRGSSYTDIQEDLNVCRGTAYNRVQSALDKMRPHADVDKYRSIQIAELDISRKALRKIIMGFGTSYENEEVLTAIRVLMKLQEHEAKLLGLNKAPTQFDKISAMSDAELAEYAKSMSAEIEAEIVDGEIVEDDLTLDMSKTTFEEYKIFKSEIEGK